MKTVLISEIIATILKDAGILNERQKRGFSSRYTVTPISADGSARLFFRVVRGGESLCVGVAPGDDSAESMAEARSAMAIGSHLLSKNIPLPDILGADERSGVILFADCGDIRLHDVLHTNTEAFVKGGEQFEILRRLVAILAHMQVEGADGFMTQWCCDTARYDTSVRIFRESHYFYNEFWLNLLQGHQCPGIEEEFADIAAQAGTGPDGYFLHRDFQSRNVMVIGSQLKIIDFQGGRLGPPGYDLASLLIDPYSDIPAGVQAELMDVYLLELHRNCEYDEKAFLRQYDYLALQRNLQILGAFSFLSQKRNKPFFKNYIRPALHTLCRLTANDEMQHYRQLRGIVDKAQSLLKDL